MGRREEWPNDLARKQPAEPRTWDNHTATSREKARGRRSCDTLTAQHRRPGPPRRSGDFNTTSRGSPDPRAGNTDPSGRAVRVMAQEKHGGLCVKATPLGQSPLGGRVGRAGRRQTTRQDREGRPRLGTDGCRVLIWAQQRFSRSLWFLGGCGWSHDRGRQDGGRLRGRVSGQMTRREEVSGATLRLHVTASPPEGGQREPTGWKKAAPGAVVATAGQRKRPLQAARQHCPALPSLAPLRNSRQHLNDQTAFCLMRSLCLWPRLCLSPCCPVPIGPKCKAISWGPSSQGCPGLAPHTLSPAGQLGSGLLSRR